MPKETSKKQNKEKKHLIKDFKAELKRVIWPTPKQLLNNTVAVITVVIITAAIVFVLDLAFESLNTYGIEKLKSMVDTSENTESNVDTEGMVSIDNSIDNTTDESSNNVSEESTNTVAEESNNE